ncbi:MAG: hypothetical protein IPK13_27340 [Deltaproteobacteria bacterium]|nr:hypothetical protein [Deltaproteobacteria bacterium]
MDELAFVPLTTSLSPSEVAQAETRWVLETAAGLRVEVSRATALVVGRPLAEAAELAKAAADAQRAATSPPKGPRNGNRRELWKAGLLSSKNALCRTRLRPAGVPDWASPR